MGKLSLSALLLLLPLVFASKAAALPGDPLITPLAPGDGVTLPAVEEGLKVTYACNAYRTALEIEEGEVEGEEGEIEVVETVTPVPGGSEEYGVVFSTGSALDAAGRLVSIGFGEAGEAESEVVKGTPNCTSELELPTSPDPAVLYQGKVYWQAFRECEGCPSGYETGPLQSFVVSPTIEEGEIVFENHVYGGYMTKVDFLSSSGLKGAKVLLQQWTGSEWKTIAEEPGNEVGENSFFVRLGSGHKLLRPVVVGSGVTVYLEEMAKTVRRSKKGPRTPVSTGAWAFALKPRREEFHLSFDVTNGGTMLRGLSAAVEATCKGPGKDEKVTIEATSAVKSAPIAPDGSVVTHFATTGVTPTTVTLTGNFFGGRFSGLLTSSFLNCSGFREFEAVPVES